MKRTETYNPFANIDKFCVLFYFLLVLMGWLNIYAAVYNEEHKNIFDISQKYGKELMWIGTATVLAVVILFIEADFYTVFAYVFYGILLVLCIAVPFVGREIKGSKSWFGFGGFGSVGREIGSRDRARRLRGRGVRHHADDAAKVARVKPAAWIFEINGGIPADRVGSLQHVGYRARVDLADVAEIGLAWRSP